MADDEPQGDEADWHFTAEEMRQHDAEKDAEIQRLSGIIRAARSYTQSRQWWGERYPNEGPLPEHNLLALHRLLDEIDDEHLREASRARSVRTPQDVRP